MHFDQLTHAVDYHADYLKQASDEDLNAGASVWLDKILGRMGEKPSECSRFGWFAEERDQVEAILYTALRLAAGIPNLTRNPARILYRLTKADSPTAIMAHTVTVCTNGAGRHVLEWTAQIKEMG